MGRIVLFVVVLGGLAWLASSMLQRSASEASGGVPTRQLENARKAGERIEREQQERLDTIEEKTAQ
ncbi:MAG: hypothetical protein L0Y66_08975 [Myxococcaceae bacterium]|nr:hypothetical protein [Myxococcaceae bacterium]MCI0673703.1 hypothetical protein [Myxococcaceae bacterium]